MFRALFIATLVSNVGGSMEDVGETWLMTSLGGTPLMVALVQSSASLPVLMLALPAGALADILDRRRLLIATQAWMTGVAALLGVLSLGKHVGPWGLLACTFAMGVGSAVDAPAWQAVIADVVPQSDVPRATVANEVGFNASRIAGPALGGLVVAWAGPGATFLINALTFVGVLVVLVRWQRRREPSTLPAERVWVGVRTGYALRARSRDASCPSGTHVHGAPHGERAVGAPSSLVSRVFLGRLPSTASSSPPSASAPSAAQSPSPALAIASA